VSHYEYCEGTVTCQRSGLPRSTGSTVGGGSAGVSFGWLPHEVSVQTTYWGSRSELVEVLELGARGLVWPRTTTYGLDDAPAAYRDMRSGTLTARAVVVP
jgi:propanol-preferring alcohol dehydrogenase